jgi:hypothetical protein
MIPTIIRYPRDMTCGEAIGIAAVCDAALAMGPCLVQVKYIFLAPAWIVPMVRN